MARKIERSIRQSQVVSNFGVGALYDILGESLVLVDTRQWLREWYKGKGREIRAERLLENLKSKAGYFNVSSLFEPATQDSSATLPFMRFPRWLFCSTCRRMKHWKFEDEVPEESPVCSFCENHPKLTPMRFIVICEEGHMADVDWARWAHSSLTTENQKTCQSKDLEFITGYSRSGGLGSIAVKCRSCGAGRTLEGITAPNILRSVGVNCSGKQPWQSGDEAVPCQSRIHVVQRGAGNVYYPQIGSALTIPPESQHREGQPVDRKSVIMDHRLAHYLTHTEHKEFFETIVKEIAKDLDYPVEEIIVLSRTLNEEAAAGDTAPDIQMEEWNALITEIDEAHDHDKFVTKHMDVARGSRLPELAGCMDKLVSVIKLREVRALTGFFRYHPGGTEGNSPGNAIRPDLDGSLTWLPAVEVFGEGVFLTLNESNLRQWEQLPEIRKRAAVLARRAVDSSLEYFLPEVTPRYILLHTLAHLLIRRLAFESGYSSASLRERIYSAEPGSGDRAGILIYTAAGDSEGTLGGLARQAEGPRFTETLLSALQDAANCSSDPICMESKGQGLDTLNLAACHACALVSETSCTSVNSILDRAMVIGGSEVPGFFQTLLNAALESTIKVSIEK